jgi:ABC-type dipeptide/oligopeptide/nickel transport system permease subunit
MDRINQFTLEVGLSFLGILRYRWSSRHWRAILGVDPAIAFTSVPVVMRVVRGSVLKEKESQYVEAARMMGATDMRIIFRHLLPNVAPIIIILASAAIPAAILAEAALSFLGLGIRPPTASWGGDLSGEARRYFECSRGWRLAGHRAEPGCAGVQSAGDTMRDVLDHGCGAEALSVAFSRAGRVDNARRLRIV